MEDKIQFLLSQGFSKEYTDYLKEYIENNDFEKYEQKEADKDIDEAESAENIIIQKVNHQNTVFLIDE